MSMSERERATWLVAYGTASGVEFDYENMEWVTEKK
jgi:hypothetical protein